MSDAERAFDNFLGVKEEPASPSRSQLPGFVERNQVSIWSSLRMKEEPASLSRSQLSGFLERDQVSMWSRSQNRWVEDSVVRVVHRRDQHRDGFFWPAGTVMVASRY